MFDFGNAFILGLVITGLVALARSLVYGSTQDRIVTGICLLISFVGVQLVAASDFAKQQVLLETPLNQMNFWSQLVVALLGAGIASGIWQGLKAVKNVGQNQNDPSPPAVQNVAVPRQEVPQAIKDVT